MPWKASKGGGYRTKRGGKVKRPGKYEAMRRKGLPKSAAARIANAPSKGKRKRSRR